MPETVGGTVIQRSFIGRETANIIHVASVPLAELGFEDDEYGNDIFSDILGVPESSILTPERYLSILNDIRRRGPPPYPYYPWGSPRAEQLFYSALYREPEGQPVFFDFLSALVAGPAVQQLSPLNLFLLDLEASADFPLNPAILATVNSCLSARIYGGGDIINFINEIYHFDIPMGQSPHVSADNLLTLLETSKKYCIAPLALGGAQAANLLAQGSYGAAILTTATAGAMTLMLIGTVAVGAVIVQRVAQRRSRRGGTTPTGRGGRGGPPLRPPPAPAGGGAAALQPPAASTETQTRIARVRNVPIRQVRTLS